MSSRPQSAKTPTKRATLEIRLADLELTAQARIRECDELAKADSRISERLLDLARMVNADRRDLTHVMDAIQEIQRHLGSIEARLEAARNRTRWERLRFWVLGR